MPYIKKEDRSYLAPALAAISATPPRNAGELNFVISSIVAQYLKSAALSYGRINEVVGVMEAAKLEFYRRVAEPYEDKKIKENGDVYPSEF